MEIYYIVLCCVLFMTVASLSSVNAIPEDDNDSIVLYAQGRKAAKCSAKKPCQNGGHCKNGSCICQQGTRGKFCGVIDECPHLCPNTTDVKCSYDISSLKAYCRCQNNNFRYNTNTRQCTKCNCGAYGTCSFQNGQKTCRCQSGFSVKNGRCEPCNCGPNSAYCHFVNGVKHCQCKDLYADRYGTCEECNCGTYSRNCYFNNNQKMCSCLEGFVQKGEMCQLGCSAKNPCQNGGYCMEGFCFCPKGTRGHFCEVIDECSYLCPITTDIKCSYDVSSQKAYCRCLNSDLRYNPNTRQCRVVCSPKNPCQNGGYCTNGFCFCPKGTRGHLCEVIDECSYLCPNTTDIKCSYDVSTQRAYCRCLNGNLRYNPILRQCRGTCQTHEQCVNGFCRNGVCVCPPGTWGDWCENVDCVTGAYTCMDQIYLLWRGSDTLFLLWKREGVLMKFVRENVVLPSVTDCQYGSRVQCNNHYDILWCHAGYTIYVPTPQNTVLRYRRVDFTGSRCSGNILPRTEIFHHAEKKPDFIKIGLGHYVKSVDE